MKPSLFLLPFLLFAVPSPAQEKANAPAKKRAAAKVPDDVERRTVSIWSDGTRMAGHLYLPKDRKPGDKLPAVVLCAEIGRAHV